MSQMSTAYKLDGEPLELESLRCWRLVSDAANAAVSELEMPLGVVPDAIREMYVDAEEALRKLRSLAHGIVVETERYERTGRDDDALAAALEDAVFQGKIKRESMMNNPRQTEPNE
jgi:hypothetical protein